ELRGHCGESVLVQPSCAEVGRASISDERCLLESKSGIRAQKLCDWFLEIGRDRNRARGDSLLHEQRRMEQLNASRDFTAVAREPLVVSVALRAVGNTVPARKRDPVGRIARDEIGERRVGVAVRVLLQLAYPGREAARQ